MKNVSMIDSQRIEKVLLFYITPIKWQRDDHHIQEVVRAGMFAKSGIGRSHLRIQSEIAVPVLFLEKQTRAKEIYRPDPCHFPAYLSRTFARVD